MTPIVSIAAGLGLAAASGFRAFVPLLLMSLAARGGLLTLTPGMEWVASDAALLALATATIAEILAYYLGSTICSIRLRRRPPRSPGCWRPRR